MDFLLGEIRATAHRGSDDLLSAGLGLDGLRGAPVAFADPLLPTPTELRRRAIQAAWNSIADLGPLGGYGSVYGAVPNVPGREFHAFATLPGARSPHRVLAQIPDRFDATSRCLIVTASSGSRGIYGAIAFAGACGLGRGCAVAYTDKGGGSGYFDCGEDSGVALDGTRARRGAALLEFAADGAAAGTGIAIKHAHSEDNPEGDWGRHLLQAVQFGLAMLDRAHPQLAPFTMENTRVLAFGLSNGGGAALQAAGLDDAGWLNGVVAVEPNVYAPLGPGARQLYDYAAEAAIWMPSALGAPQFDATPFARDPDTSESASVQRGATLRRFCMVDATAPAGQSAEALEHLRAGGWNDMVLATAASSSAFDMWRALLVTYSSAYARTRVGAHPAGFRFAALDSTGRERAATGVERASWWSDASGIAPGYGVFLIEQAPPDPDPYWPGIARMSALQREESPDGDRLRVSIAATAARLPRPGLPVFVVHGAADGLVPPMFSSAPYVAWLRANGRDPVYWRVPHVQHFDAFCALPTFGDRYVPMLPYAYAAFDRMFDHVLRGAPLGAPTPAPRPRGSGALDRGRLDFGGIA